MRTYWCRFLDAGGHVYGAEKLEAEDDAAAIAKARIIHAHGIGNGYEIWDGQRRIHRETHRRATPTA